MVFASDILAGHARPDSALVNLFGDLKSAFVNRRAYRRTVAELSALSNSELDDLGMHRGEIHAIAMKSVYGVSV